MAMISFYPFPSRFGLVTVYSIALQLVENHPNISTFLHGEYDHHYSVPMNWFMIVGCILFNLTSEERWLSAIVHEYEKYESFWRFNMIKLLWKYVSSLAKYSPVQSHFSTYTLDPLNRIHIPVVVICHTFFHPSVIRHSYGNLHIYRYFTCYTLWFWKVTLNYREWLANV